MRYPKSQYTLLSPRKHVFDSIILHLDVTEAQIPSSALLSKFIGACSPSKEEIPLLSSKAVEGRGLARANVQNLQVES